MTFVEVEPPSVRRLGLAVALVLAPLAVLEVLESTAGNAAVGPWPQPAAVALVLLATLPLSVLDRRPRTVVVVSGAAVLASMVSGWSMSLEGLALLIAVGACSYRAGRQAAVVATLAGCAGVVLGPALTPSGIGLGNALSNALLMTASAYVGLTARIRRSYALRLEHHARELEELRASEMREIVAQERLRIAREVHDVVGHALAAIALHARVGTRRLGRDPEGTAQSLAEISELAASALAETREAVGQLRTTGDADLRPQRGLDDLDELVAALRASDVPVTFRREGEGPPVPAVVQSAAYRIVQESLSNVARHARPANAAVLVRREPHALVVDVSDDGRAPADPGVDGHGLVGMRERASGLGGTLEAGPAPDGGWRVHAILPTGPVPA